jgi:hypothetical protein
MTVRYPKMKDLVDDVVRAIAATTGLETHVGRETVTFAPARVRLPISGARRRRDLIQRDYGLARRVGNHTRAVAVVDLFRLSGLVSQSENCIDRRGTSFIAKILESPATRQPLPRKQTRLFNIYRVQSPLIVFSVRIDLPAVRQLKFTFASLAIAGAGISSRNSRPESSLNPDM